MPSLPPAANLFASSLPSFLFRRRKQRYDLNPPEEAHQVIYLGNVLTVMGKGEASVDKPLAIIWRTWNARRGGQQQQIGMRLAVTRSGLKAETKQLGLTEYFAHRITFCTAPAEYPRIFCWVYKHEGKRMKPELRCHAVLCKKASEPARLQRQLSDYLHSALQEYKREKSAAERMRKNSLLSTCPRRKLILQTGALNFRPPLSRSRSAPRLGSIDEELEEEALEACQQDQQEEEHFEEEEDETGGGPSSSDLDDLHSLSTLEAKYRTSPMLSGDSSSQHSATSSSNGTGGSEDSAGGGGREERRAADGEEENNSHSHHNHQHPKSETNKHSSKTMTATEEVNGRVNTILHHI